MSCYPELTYCVYVDGELPAEEARPVEAHLAACSGCRALVEALQAENRFLAAALEEPEVVTAPVPTRLRDVVWTTLAVLAAAVGLNTAYAWVTEARPPEAAEWLNPFSLSGQVNLFFSTLFYFVEEGATMLASSFAAISALVFGLVILAAAAFLLRRRPATMALLVTVAVVLGLAMPGAAFEKRKSNTIIVAKGETLDDTLLAYGETITIDGVLTGNLIVFGKQVAINGTVKGDVISFSQSLDMNGTVEGNVFSFSQWLTSRGGVNNSFYAFTQNFRLDPAARVAGDLVAFLDQGSVDGSVGRDFYSFASGLDVRGNVGRNLTVKCHRLNLLAPARVGGDLTVHVERRGKRAHVAPGGVAVQVERKGEGIYIDPAATIIGKTETILPKPKESPYYGARFYVQQALGLAIGFLIGLLLHWLFPALFAARLQTVGAALRAAGVGFLALVATPVGALILAIVLGGVGLVAGVFLIATLIPILAVVLWLLAVYLAKLFVALLLGRALLRAAPGQPPRFALPLLVGLVLVVVAFQLPYVGNLLHFLVWLVGLGILVLQVHRHYWARPAPAA